jgi:hypothetical protein
MVERAVNICSPSGLCSANGAGLCQAQGKAVTTRMLAMKRSRQSLADDCDREEPLNRAYSADCGTWHRPGALAYGRVEPRLPREFVSVQLLRLFNGVPTP